MRYNNRATSLKADMAHTILCVEDEPDLLEDLSGELREAGYTVIEATDGTSSLDAIAAGGIDLILCDVQLPGMNGLQIRQHLIDTGSSARIPFALLTAYSDGQIRAEAERLAVEHLIVKPIDYDELLDLIPRLLCSA